MISKKKKHNFTKISKILLITNTLFFFLKKTEISIKSVKISLIIPRLPCPKNQCNSTKNNQRNFTNNQYIYFFKSEISIELKNFH